LLLQHCCILHPPRHHCYQLQQPISKQQSANSFTFQQFSATTETQTKLAQLAFLVTIQHIWNSLPSNILSCHVQGVFNLMPLPLTVSCFSKIQIGFTFLVPAHLGSPRKRAVKRVCVWWLVGWLEITATFNKILVISHVQFYHLSSSNNWWLKLLNSITR